MILELNCLFLLTLTLSVTSKMKEERAKIGTLKLVQVIFRHGDRAPTHTYPNYENFQEHWPDGMGQLTNLGKLQQYELGQYLRNRYKGFIWEKYDRFETYAMSSDMDRSIESLECVLAGLYPPANEFWHPKLHWEPIPLRTISRKEDNIIYSSAKCPRYSQIRSHFMFHSEVVQKLNHKYADFMRFCSENSGLHIKHVWDLYRLYEIFYAQAAHNLTLPQWTQDENTMGMLEEVNSIVNTFSTYDDEMKRLRGGPFLNLLINNMHAITGGRLRSISEERKLDVNEMHSVKHKIGRKLLLYSGHDSTLYRMLNTMDIFEPHCPPYSTALFIELHYEGESLEYFVEFYYRNDTTKKPFQLTPTKCEKPCRLSTFAKKYHHLIPINWHNECRLGSFVESNQLPQDHCCCLSPFQFAWEGTTMTALAAILGLIIIIVFRHKNIWVLSQA